MEIKDLFHLFSRKQEASRQRRVDENTARKRAEIDEAGEDITDASRNICRLTDELRGNKQSTG